MLHRIKTAVQSSPPDIEKKRACNRLDYRLLAEWVGFEPTVPEGTTDFESFQPL